MSTAKGYPRWQSAPPTLPHIEAQKAVRDAHAPRDPLAADPGARTVYRLRPPTAAAARGASQRLRDMLDPEQLAAVEGARGRVLRSWTKIKIPLRLSGRRSQDFQIQYIRCPPPPRRRPATIRRTSGR